MSSIRQLGQIGKPRDLLGSKEGFGHVEGGWIPPSLTPDLGCEKSEATFAQPHRDRWVRKHTKNEKRLIREARSIDGAADILPVSKRRERERERERERGGVRGRERGG